MTTAMTPETTRERALSALITRHVFDTEHDPETIVICGHGYSDDDIAALVSQWLLHTEGADVCFVHDHSEVENATLGPITVVHVDKGA